MLAGGLETRLTQRNVYVEREEERENSCIVYNIDLLS